MTTAASRTVEIAGIPVANHRPLVLIAGPCAIEGRQHALEVAGRIRAITQQLGLGFIYKSSFDKANRTSATSPRGVGLEQGLEVLAAVRQEVGCPVLTDVHESWQCRPVAEVVDVLQIPAFLCRQTDLLAAAAATGRPVFVKKGQFLAPWDMQQVAAKLEHFGAAGILLGERGTTFGYNNLVVDMRGLVEMAATGWPVVMDATHAVQRPGGLGGRSGGERRFVPVLARAAVAVGVAAVFLETHEHPERAPSDGPNMVPLDRLAEVLEDLLAFDRLAKSRPRPQLD